MMKAEVPPCEGLVAGKYQLVRLLGRGGMGSVWEARHASLGTPSAIKFIESEYAASEEARSRFDKEAKAAATIQSKHAIQVYDHGVTDDGKPYIVMELLTGEPLDKRIDRHSRMSLQDTAKILQQVCRGLSRAHERGIIHRDLKPENIFIVRNTDDDEEIAKVLDFGIAKMQNSPGSPGISSSTKTGAVLGTPFYMSPEQARGLRNVDHRTDVWSLGVIAFKCVTGKLPFDGESVGDLLVKICTGPVPVPSQVVPGIPPAFDAWFMRAMEREPERRFGSVLELSDALCFAAGIATKSYGAPLSNQQTLGAPGSGVLTPNHHIPSSVPGGAPGMNASSGPSTGGYAQAASGYGQQRPGHQTPNGYAQQTPQHQGRALTPPPGALTNAPFTAESIAGVPASSGKGKLVFGLVAAVLIVGGVAFGAVSLLKKGQPGPDAATAATTPPPPATSIAAVLEDKHAKPVETAPGAGAAVPVEAKVDTPKVDAPKADPPKPTPTGKTGTKAHATAAVTPLPPPKPAASPAPAPTPKTNKNDPGY